MIRLTKLLLENTENRISLMKIEAIMAKVIPELSAAESSKLLELFTEVTVMASALNMLPYTVKDYRLQEWSALTGSFKTTVLSLREEICSIADKKKDVNFNPLILALDEVFKN
jgi:hypothetical protein